jgi:NADP-dependent 3-hydroxy acid dehydrogenase YdfG
VRNVIVITGASSGFGALAARALAIAGHTVYASMRETTGRNATQVEAAQKFAAENNVDPRPIELNVASQESADQAIKTIVGKNGRLDVVIHNAGHMVFGAAEAFTPEQLAQVYDTNVLSTQRVNRAALPTIVQTGKRPCAMGREHQHSRWHPALSFTLLRGEGCNGCACC